MATTYFSWMQPILYRGKVAPNVITRARLPDVILQNRRLFHPYQIADGDRPDTIAYFYYGNEQYDWIVLLSNNIIDPRSEWPLTSEDLVQYIVATHGSLSAANSVSHYQVDGSRASISATAFKSLPASHLKYYTYTDADQYSIRQDTIKLSSAGYANLPLDEVIFWSSVTFYEDEVEINEQKRLIYLIDASYVPEIERNLRDIFDV